MKKPTMLVNNIENHLKIAEYAKTEKLTEWEDERKCYVGDQWSLSFMRSSANRRTSRPASVDNMIFPAVEYKKYILTSNTPETVVTVLGNEIKDFGKLDEPSKLLTKAVDSILYKNEYSLLWDRIILQGLMHGCLISYVGWDGDWKGGQGANRWIGECQIDYVRKEDFFADPQVDDWEINLQECEFVIRKQMKPAKWFKKEYPDSGIQWETVERKSNYKQEEIPLYLYFHKGEPDHIPDEWKKIWRDKAELTDNPLEKEKFESYIKGDGEGVHLAIYTNGVLLEYLPYIYDDGRYPFAFKVIHVDEDTQWGFGEIKNVIQPQVNMNSIDEIEAEAYSKQGLGGYFLQSGSMNPRQKKTAVEHSHKGGAILEVDNINGIKERQPIQTPNGMLMYKGHKKNMVGEIIGYNAIQQGEAKSGTPYKSVLELGSRADVRTIGIIKKAEMFHREIIELVISRIRQFYGFNRMLVAFENNMPYQEEYDPNVVMKSWEREVDGEIVQETYFPEYDIRVTIVDAKPNDRQYYINIANMMHERGFIDMISYMETIEEGKLPPKEVIMERLEVEKQKKMEEMLQVQQMQQQQSMQMEQQAEGMPMQIGEMPPMDMPQGEQTI